MKIAHLRIVILLIVVGVTPVPSVRAAPICDCFYYPNHSRAFRETKAIFIGEVIKVDRRAEIPEDVTHVYQAITFKVVKRWKGAQRSNVTAWESGTHESCAGWKFQEGEKYLIYADSQKGVLIVDGYCSRTRRIETNNADAIREFKELNSPEFLRKVRK